MKYLLSFLILFLCLSGLYAQDFCKASSVFFDLNKSELKSEGQLTVDSLIKTMNNSEFILEIYGYTDTSNTSDYNSRLSQNRIDAVLNYLKSKKVAPKEIRTFNEGEDFNSSVQSKHPAFQRRVDVYLTPMEGNDVTFKSPDGVIIKRDLSSFGDCGICALKPKMKYLQTEADAKANGIDLVTDRGERLVTYGMVLFDIDTCFSVSKEEQQKFETCMEVPAPFWNDRVKLFELVEQSGNDNWRQLDESIIYDSVARVARFCSGAKRINCDLILDRYIPGKLYLIFPEESQTGKSFFLHYPQSKPERLFNDTMNFPDDIETVISYYSINKEWYLYKEKAQRILNQFLNRDSVSSNACLLYTSDYKIASPKEEMELKVKVNGIDKIGYYHPDFDLFIPLERRGGNTWYGPVYQDGFELCYIKKDKYYIEKNKAKKLKVKTKNGISKAKLKQVYLLKKNKLSWRKAKRRELV
ncbi:MAG: OmpA/MotB domain protein [Fluviicola sp.]|jgi:hypothetical protein|uniref:OmpA family protein n=1 Tax=Fluviicola sp. TaxID=1917219 RepID=UPI002622B7E5|nr:OmpA family protein [Fluviicola sp.]MDF3026291.1 OmpA/MotB domain protein [Fluviicola sp.]